VVKFIVLMEKIGTLLDRPPLPGKVGATYEGMGVVSAMLLYLMS
jgi:hypothetical protein